MKKADIFFNALRLPLDFLMLLVAGITTYLFRTELLSFFRPVYFEFNLPLLHYSYLVVFVSLLFLGAYAIMGLYSMKNRMGKAEELFKIVIGSSAGVMMIIIYIFLRQELFNSRFLILGGWFFSILFVCIGRFLIRKMQTFFVSKYDFGIHKTVLIGNAPVALQILDQINQNRSYGYRVVKHLMNPEMGEIQNYVGSLGVDEVILADPDYPVSRVIELIEFCHENSVIFKFVPNLYNTLTTNFDVDSLNGLPLIELKRTVLDGWGRVIKRIVDIIFSSLALIILSPIMAVVAFAVKWDTEGSVFLRQKRMSKNREFMLYKFRSMVQNAEELLPYLQSLNERGDGPLFKIKKDPRVTRVGRFIRRYRIDELAQFINIFKGDMSLVGPRPHLPNEISKFEKHHKKVLAIKAGATGLAQVSGSSDLPFEQEVVLDSFYIDNWSLYLDIKIILKTALKIFTDRSAV